MITLDLYRHDRSRPQWHAVLPGANGSGLTPWAAISEALTVWKRRGCPTESPIEHHAGGASWVIASIFDRGPGHHYRYHVTGINLGCAPDTYGRVIAWDVARVDDPRYEILPGAWESWRCLTCTRLGRGAPPTRCPSCDSERDANHGPHASAAPVAHREAA